MKRSQVAIGASVAIAVGISIFALLPSVSILSDEIPQMEPMGVGQPVQTVPSQKQPVAGGPSKPISPIPVRPAPDDDDLWPCPNSCLTFVSFLIYSGHGWTWRRLTEALYQKRILLQESSLSFW
jgi:hypothetical protein